MAGEPGGVSPCAACGRPNGEHRQTCMYCGTPISGGSGEQEESLGREFESLLRGESGSGVDRESVIPEQQDPIASEEDGGGADSAFAAAMLSSLGIDDEEATDPGHVGLPPQRRPFLMVVDTRDGALLVAQMAKVLGVDGVTAGIIVRSTWWRPALWGDALGDLETIADRVRHDLDTKVSILATADMHGIPAMRGVMCAGEKGQLVLSQPGWRGGAMEPDEGAPEGLTLDDFSLAVPGVVVVRRFRKGADRGQWSHKKGATQTEMGERRVEVLDLHGTLHSARIVAGSTDLSGLPGHQEGPGLISYRLFLDSLANRMELLGRRTCYPQGIAPVVLDEDSPAQKSLAGWSVWEEHSRICALHALRRR